MLAICAYYAGIMLNVFATYYAHNCAGIIGSSLLAVQAYLPWMLTNNCLVIVCMDMLD